MKNIILGLTAASLCALAPIPMFSQPAFSGPSEGYGNAALKAKEHASYLLVNRHAQTGNAEAQYSLGVMYYNGQSVLKQLGAQ